MLIRPYFIYEGSIVILAGSKKISSYGINVKNLKTFIALFLYISYIRAKAQRPM